MIAKTAMALMVCMMLSGCVARSEAALERFEFNQPHMGVQVRIVMFAKNSARATAAAEAAYSEIARLESIMSDYRADSEVAMLGRRSGGEPLPISCDLYAALDLACQISAATGGAFDITIGPVTNLWRGASESGVTPSAAEIERAHQLVNWRDLILDREHQTARLAQAAMRIDLGGIGQGYAADRALEVLRRHGVTCCLVDVSGDIAIGDPPPRAAGWAIALATDPSKATRLIHLRNSAISTSASTGRIYEVQGVRHSHLVDPRRSKVSDPVPRRMVTVIAPQCATADAWATALCVLNPNAGLAISESMPGMAVLIVNENETPRMSRRFQALARINYSHMSIEPTQ